MERVEMRNLTGLGLNPDLIQAETAKFINEAAKPGDGYELWIGKGGRVKWEGYDADPKEQPVEIAFDPDRRSLMIEVPDYINVTVKKVRKL